MIALEETLHWYRIDEKLPEFDVDVIIACENGDVRWGRRAEVYIPVINKTTGLYDSREKKVQWGMEQNDFEYWTEFPDVIFWAYFPKLLNIETNE